MFEEYKKAFSYGKMIAEGINVFTDDKMRHLDINGTAWVVYQEDEFMLYIMNSKPNIASAAVVVMNVQVNILQTRLVPVYVVNSAFLELPDTLKECILYHEQGHVALGHVQKKEPLWRSIMTKVLLRRFKEQEIEFQADLYAWKRVGDVYFELLEYWKWRGALHIDKRIKELEKRR